MDTEQVRSFVPYNQITSGKYATRDCDHTRPKADEARPRKVVK